MARVKFEQRHGDPKKATEDPNSGENFRTMLNCEPIETVEDKIRGKNELIPMKKTVMLSCQIVLAPDAPKDEVESDVRRSARRSWGI